MWTRWEERTTSRITEHGVSNFDFSFRQFRFCFVCLILLGATGFWVMLHLSRVDTHCRCWGGNLMLIGVTWVCCFFCSVSRMKCIFMGDREWIPSPRIDYRPGVVTETINNPIVENLNRGSLTHFSVLGDNYRGYFYFYPRSNSISIYYDKWRSFRLRDKISINIGFRTDYCLFLTQTNLFLRGCYTFHTSHHKHTSSPTRSTIIQFHPSQNATLQNHHAPLVTI